MATKTLAMQWKKISFELHFLIFGIIPRKKKEKTRFCNKHECKLKWHPIIHVIDGINDRIINCRDIR